MARPYQISSAFDALSALYGAEHAEADDQGASQVDQMIKALRSFKQHEDAERAKREQLAMHARTAPMASLVREASYAIGGGKHVYYQSDDTMKDAADLYSVLAEEHTTGSPNVENEQAKALVSHLQSGRLLGEPQIALLRDLMVKHGSKIDAFRAKGDKHGQNLLPTPTEGADARIMSAPTMGG